MSFPAKTPKGWLMPKALCLIGMVISILVFLIFFLDIVFGVSGMKNLAPFGLASLVMDILFILSSAGLAIMGWLAFREQK